MARINRCLDWIVSAFLCLCVSALVVIAFGQVVGRYLIGISFSWAEDLCVVLFAWTIWTSACLLMRDNRHLNLTILTSAVSPKTARGLRLSSHVITLAFLAVVFWTGLGAMEAMTGMEFTALPLPLNGKFSSVSVGAALLFYYVIRCLLAELKER